MTRKDSKGRPECKQNRPDCLAYKNGNCRTLSDTEFNRPCPFYCTEKMVYEKLPKDMADEVMRKNGKRRREK